MSSNKRNLEDRCRLILVAPVGDNAKGSVKSALLGGDVASVIMQKGALSDTEYVSHVEALLPIIQDAGAAGLVMFDTQLMGRSNADGLFVPSDIDVLLEMKGRFHPDKIIGFGGAKNKHNSMVAGDVGPDFIFFGKVDGDIKPEAHPKNIELGNWWSDLVEIPCVVMGGNALESVVEIAKSGVEFVAASKCVFEGDLDPEKAVQKINQLLDEHAPDLSLEP